MNFQVIFAWSQGQVECSFPLYILRCESHISVIIFKNILYFALIPLGSSGEDPKLLIILLFLGPIVCFSLFFLFFFLTDFVQSISFNSSELTCSYLKLMILFQFLKCTSVGNYHPYMILKRQFCRLQIKKLSKDRALKFSVIIDCKTFSDQPLSIECLRFIKKRKQEKSSFLTFLFFNIFVLSFIVTCNREVFMHEYKICNLF